MVRYVYGLADDGFGGGQGAYIKTVAGIAGTGRVPSRADLDV